MKKKENELTSVKKINEDSKDKSENKSIKSTSSPNNRMIKVAKKSKERRQTANTATAKEKAGKVHSRDKSEDVNAVGPLLVHCSAGIGRTGTFVLLHTMAEQLREGSLNAQALKAVTLQPLLSKMREQRPGFIQQKSQYLFCYEAMEYAGSVIVESVRKEIVSVVTKEKVTKEENEKG